MSQKIPLARYIFQRLRQYGVNHIHGVPGDNLLRALDQISPAGSRWVGCCNELNAAYAADGYARVRGMGAVFTTMGVGELSAANAVAGSQAERVPVIHLVGVPSRAAMTGQTRNHQAVHHTLQPGKGNWPFPEIGTWLSEAADTVGFLPYSDSGDSATDVALAFDKALRKSFVQSRTLYFPLRADIVDKEIDSSWLQRSLDDKFLFEGLDHYQQQQQQQQAVDDKQFADSLLDYTHAAKQPVILVDRGLGMDAMRKEINDFVRVSGIPTFCMPSGAGMIDNSLPNYHGVHSGPAGRFDSTAYTHSADLVIAFGPMFSDTNTMGWKTVPKPSASNPKMKVVILAEPSTRSTTSGTAKLEHITRESLCIATKLVNPQTIPPPAAELLGNWRDAGLPKNLPADEPINHTDLYDRLNTYLQPHDTVVLANATPIMGGRDFVLPEGARVIASGQWFSIGHMLPATMGAALAKRELDSNASRGRTILFEGDGSFQVTAQELSTIIAQRLDVTIFLFNNAGYACERLIHKTDEEYNEIAPWRYLDLPRAFGADRAKEIFGYETQTHAVRTWGELDVLLTDDKFCNGPGLKMVELILGRDDVHERYRCYFVGKKESLAPLS